MTDTQPYDKDSIALPGEFNFAIVTERPEMLGLVRDRILSGEVQLDVRQQARLVDLISEAIQVRFDLNEKLEDAEQAIEDIRRHMSGTETMLLRLQERLEDG